MSMMHIMAGPEGRGLACCRFCRSVVIAIPSADVDEDWFLFDPCLKERRILWQGYPGLAFAFAPRVAAGALLHNCGGFIDPAANAR